MSKYMNFLKNKLDKEQLDKLLALDNPNIVDFVGEYVELCGPKSVFIRTDLARDIGYIRNKAVQNGEEIALLINGQTAHCDGIFDQGRDKPATKYLLPRGKDLGGYLNSIDKNKGEKEIKSFLKDIMKGKEMFVCFLSLGPCRSEFSILAVQITDSAYVAHSEDILYRPGYEAFKCSQRGMNFFRFVHSAGELENKVSKNYDKKKIYIDVDDKIVYSVHTQYAGNTVGLKKLALRLAIDKASGEGWLAEHMFVMGVHNREGEKAYFCGAYPSMCGKTSTAMLSGESIVGDDIAYLKVRDDKVFAVNVERGIFGIIKGINSVDDSILFKALIKEGEVIFSNILIDEKKYPFWEGKDAALPEKGVNFYGDWFPGKKDSDGQEIPVSHKNARFTISLAALENTDENLDNPDGVEIKGVIYGGRDSDTSVPVEEAFSWRQGIITKAAALESETTAATLDKEGVRVFNPMSNIDFLSVPLGKYIDMNLKFGEKVKTAPRVFSVNYFLRDEYGRFLNDICDKRVWLRWMRSRIDGSARGLNTPTGIIPKYEDLKELFKELLGKDYAPADYVRQFTIRIARNLAKIQRIRKIYGETENIPAVLFEELNAQEKRLIVFRDKFGEYISPLEIKNKI